MPGECVFIPRPRLSRGATDSGKGPGSAPTVSFGPSTGLTFTYFSHAIFYWLSEGKAAETILPQTC